MRNAFSRRRVAAGLALAATASLVLSTGSAAHADLTHPTAHNGVFNIFIEPGSQTGDPANAIANGYWGHETSTNDQGSVISADLTDGGDAMLAAYGASDFDHFGIAFVPAGGELPTVTSGERIGDAYQYFTNFGFGYAMTSNAAADSVASVSTQSEWDAWVADGKPTQQIGTDLVSHDPLRTGNPVSTAPQGKSILNRWAAGQHLSMVVVKITGYDSSGEPLLAPGPVAGWMSFTTAADSARPAATSAKYAVDVVKVNTTTTLDTIATPVGAGSTVTFTAHVSGNVAGRTVTFLDGSTPIGTNTTDATGTASISTSTLSSGDHTISASFAGDGTGNASASSAQTLHVNNKLATNTALSTIASTVNTGDHVTLTATVSGVADTTAHPAGSVAFMDGTTTLGTVPTDTSGVASFDWVPTTGQVGSNTIQAVYTTPSTTYAGSSSSTQAVTVATSCTTCVYRDDQTITADVPAGSIVISTPYTPAHPLNVGTLALAGDLSRFTGFATFQDIIVNDTRAGAPHWDMTAIAGDLTSGTNKINGENVGLTNMVVQTANLIDPATGLPGSTAPVQSGTGLVTTTDHYASAATGAMAVGAPVSPTDTGSLGLKNPGTIMQRATSSLGTVTYQGKLTVQAPSYTPAGHYTGTVTFTVS